MPSKQAHHLVDDIPFLGLAIALGSGLYLSDWFHFFHPYTGLLLQLVFFASGLKLDLKVMLTELRDTKLVVMVVLLRLVVFPLFVFLIASQFFPAWTVPFVLIAAMPAGMTSPLFVDMVRGNVPLSLLLTLATSIFSVGTLPFVLDFLGGDVLLYDPLIMFRTLFVVMLVPIVLAQIVRMSSFGQFLIGRSHHVVRISSIFMLWLLIATITSKHSTALLEGFHRGDIAPIFLALTVSFVVFHIFSYVICFWRSQRDRLTVTLSLSYMNFTLAIFLAETLFRDPPMILIVILSMLPWNFGLIVFQWLIRSRGWMLPKTSNY